MPQKLQVDIASLAKKTEWLRQQKNIILQERKRLADCLKDVNLYWEGTASQNFCARVCSDIDMLDRYLDLIENVVSDYKIAADKYRHNEEHISDILRAINIE